MVQVLTERYRERLLAVLSCYDRIVITGTLPGACHAKGMTGFLTWRAKGIFDCELEQVLGQINRNGNSIHLGLLLSMVSLTPPNGSARHDNAA